MKNEMNILNKK